MLYIIIPVFNRWRYTRACLDSLRAQTNQDFRVIVVDDGSTDETAAALARAYPEVEVVTGDGNLFWTAGVNRGIERALALGADRVLTLNNDVLTAPDFVAQMLTTAAQRPTAVLGALEFDADTGQAIYGGERLDFRTNTRHDLLDVLPPSQRTGLHPVTYLPGRGLLIPKAVIDKIGLFDEQRLPHYLADFDYTSVARRAGFPVYCNYDAQLSTYPEESGQTLTRKHRSAKGYYQHLFGIRGGGNMVNFTHFALKNCPAPYLPYFLLNGYARRLVGYFLH
ncbi:glycosyltransferase family 2 protein [Hymenobacter sp. UV11]|uniref:glycosyltransferase family 2 protein n=1 Tax=Hymenobacter sp. UV11 TaxID=1849735 RepID=UPI00105B3569|nr:glycosyltransferase family 2 protein [Hymenobacter sp. UV11]TDN38340.1 family 2 glycosyl transferase [Hymenobacter sp. UV11]TFZ68063.1 glycosyltransferase family 2 protein [Hymenobacter sp. UV11]